MTEDTSPENLRKFLESDDPALIMMGLSMAKGAGVHEELLPIILRLYMWGDDKTVRAVAKSFFNKYASEEIQVKVKENWKASYRTLSVTGDRFQEAIRPFLEAFKSQDDFALIALEPLIKTLEDKDWQVRRGTIKALENIGDKRAVEPLIKTIEDKNFWVRYDAATALGNIGDKRAVEPLIKVLEDENKYVRVVAVKALGKIGDARAVESVIEALEDNYKSVRNAAAAALGGIGDARAVEPLVKALEDDGDVRAVNAAKAALRKLGHEVK